MTRMTTTKKNVYDVDADEEEEVNDQLSREGWDGYAISSHRRRRQRRRPQRPHRRRLRGIAPPASQETRRQPARQLPRGRRPPHANAPPPATRPARRLCIQFCTPRTTTTRSRRTQATCAPRWREGDKANSISMGNEDPTPLEIPVAPQGGYDDLHDPAPGSQTRSTPRTPPTRRQAATSSAQQSIAPASPAQKRTSHEREGARPSKLARPATANLGMDCDDDDIETDSPPQPRPPQPLSLSPLVVPPPTLRQTHTKRTCRPTLHRRSHDHQHYKQRPRYKRRTQRRRLRRPRHRLRHRAPRHGAPRAAPQRRMPPGTTQS